MTTIRKNMEGALPSDLPHDLLHEAKLRLGSHSALLKASFKGVISMAATRVPQEKLADPSMAQDAKRDLVEAQHGEINTRVLGELLVDSTLPHADEDVSHAIADLEPNRNAHLLVARDLSQGRSDFNQILTDLGEGPHPLNNLIQPVASSIDEMQVLDRPTSDPSTTLILYDVNKGNNQIGDEKAGGSSPPSQPDADAQQ